jgi:hypothetical protein
MAEEESLWIRLCKLGAWLQEDENQPYIQLAIFFACVVGLYLTMFTCPVCVFVIMLVSLVFCCQYRLMFLVMCASLGVLWVHGWRFGAGKGLSLQWN